MKNVLYVGMENDIILPFLVEPNFDNLYVMNYNDIGYGTWEEQIDEILSILENGSDEFIEKPVIHKMTGIDAYKIRGPVAKLPEGPCYILSSNTEKAKKFKLVKEDEFSNISRVTGEKVTFEMFATKDKTKSWKVTFMYGEKVRTLTYYLRNFKKEWPEEIKDIDSLIWRGAFTWKYFNGELTEDNDNFRKIIEKRCTLPLSIYGNSGSNVPLICMVNISKYLKKQAVSKVNITNFRRKWYDKDFSSEL